MENPEISEFGIVLLFIVGAVLFLMVALGLSRFLRPDRPNPEKLAAYECGEEAVGEAWGQFNVRFYIIALIFLLFEVEIVFLFPWAVVFGNAELVHGTGGLWGWFSLIEVFVFAGILALGLAYAWRKGFLDWVKPKPEVEEISPVVPRKLYDALNKKYEARPTQRQGEE